MTDKTLVKRKPNELRELLEGPDFREQLIKALPNAMSPERFIRITITSMMRNPKLMQCTRESVFRCLLDLSAMGLEPDGRQAHLIPRKNKTTNLVDCTLILDYKGIKELLYRNGDIVDEHSDVVGELDTFSYAFGSNKHLDHVPHTRNRGKLYCAYSFVTLPKGGSAFDVMSTDEIELIRKRSSYPDGDPWTRDWPEMAKKSVFKRLAKSLPLSPKTRDAIAVDNTYEMERQEPATPVTRTAAVGFKKLPSQEPESGYENGGEPEPPHDPFSGSGDEPGAPEPAGEPESPPEPVSAQSKGDKPPGPLGRVRSALKEAGYKPEELLKLLKAVRLANPDVPDLGKLPANALERALEDWDNVIKRLGQERAASAGATNPVNPDDFPA